MINKTVGAKINAVNTIAKRTYKILPTTVEASWVNDIETNTQTAMAKIERIIIKTIDKTLPLSP